eukprot:CAMPEP_0114539362 /NCGR_PEP_ID=MMETSP0114-20121206/197_1 /TAXON_ID=31324 /ORGANISM="Goniomonas sp, Strain m" /LENGTH=598 /DNA_ID=CAMNT_0001723459 /DNA_START=57 /DNA_END=1853 /DNA_ORIENTATION=+
MHSSLVSASLYVGDLHERVNEGELLDLFSIAGPVASIRVLRDAMTRRSLGYAYVNFHNAADAERALDTQNYTVLHGKPIRIMWKHRDPSKRKSGVGNIFIKNLEKSVDSGSLNDTFSAFGNILSCKVATDEGGNSKGYGFVQYETKEEADNAIHKVNGNIIQGKRVFVGPFLPLAERQKSGDPKFTNIFVKNLDESVSSEQLQTKFSEFGKVTSCIIMSDEAGKSRGFGFVNFENFDDAAKAVNSMNGTTPWGGKTIYCGKAEKAAHRQAELRKQWAHRKQELLAKYSGTNLYVKNLDDTIDDDKLRATFEPFGTITSAKVELDSGKSKGFGYVCFASPDDATRAVTDMNGKMVGSKPIYVALHQPKEVRRAYLQSQNLQRSYNSGQNMRNFPAQSMPMMYPGAPGARPQGQGPFMMSPFHMGPGGGRGFVPRGPMNPAMANQRGGRFRQSRPQGQIAGQPGVQPGQPQQQRSQGVKFSANVRNRDQAQNQAMPAGQQAPQQAPPPMPVVPGALSKEQLASMLVNATPEQQKQLLGERLYALIAPSQGALTGKITGMLLEGLDNGELLHLIDSPEALQSKIQEAISALQAHLEAGNES